MTDKMTRAHELAVRVSEEVAPTTMRTSVFRQDDGTYGARVEVSIGARAELAAIGEQPDDIESVIGQLRELGELIDREGVTCRIEHSLDVVLTAR